MYKKVLITGINGQDGSYLANYLLKKKYEVHGIIRKSSSDNNERLKDIINKITLHYGDLCEYNSLYNIISNIQPHEIYNLASMTNVKISFDIPEYTSDIDGIGTLRILECIKNINKNIKFYQAGTSELYGGDRKKSLNENDFFNPRSPYAVSKLYSYWITKCYRESYNIFAVNGILFNHTSPKRGNSFVEQKIIKSAVDIKYGKLDKLILGNIYTYRDFGHSKDFIEAMWLMLQQDEPDDYVISSDNTIQIKELINIIFNKLNMPLIWYGEGLNEYAMFNNNIIISISDKFYRPLDVNYLKGDSTYARNKLKWKPNYSLDMIINEMLIYYINENYDKNFYI
jgi:GDPmannose 4,6-dehydratase